MATRRSPTCTGVAVTTPGTAVSSEMQVSVKAGRMEEARDVFSADYCSHGVQWKWWRGRGAEERSTGEIQGMWQ